MSNETRVITIKINKDTTPQQIHQDIKDYLLGGSPPNVREETLEKFMTRNRPSDCDCGHIVCVCHIKKNHKDGCKFRLASTCAVPFECEHGFDACPTCDPCTCK